MQYNKLNIRQKNHECQSDNLLRNKSIKQYFFVLFILVFFTGYLKLNAQTMIDQATNFNVIPPSPEVTELGSYSNRGINGATGTPDITIPIYTIEIDGVSVPISISYNATGIKAEDMSTEVGLKWSLQAGGSISRTIRGLADDQVALGWFYYNGTNFPDLSWNNPDNIGCCQGDGGLLNTIANNDIDVLPDVYNYDFAGYHGTFFFDKNKNHYKVIEDDVRLTPYWGTSNFSKFELTDKMGIVYEFGGTGYTSFTDVDTKANSIDNDPRSGSGVTEWKLKRITTRNGNTISFTYTPYSFNYTLSNNQTKKSSDTSAPLGWDLLTTHSTTYSFNLQLPLKIETDYTKVDFVYSTDASASGWKKKLTEIKITDKLHSKTKSYLLEYDRYSSNSKLRLRKLKEKGTSGGISGKVWKFNYDTNMIPAITSKDIDFFGYYNGMGNSNYVPISYNSTYARMDTINDRNVNPLTISNGILKEIVYPTGGKTVYYYEANQDLDNYGKVIYAPGVRVRRIEDIDTDNTKYKVKEYEYSGLTGNTQERNNYNNYQRHYVESLYDDVVTYSSPFDVINQISGYCYQNVTINHYDGTILEFHEEEEYAANKKNYTLHPKLMEKRTYDNLNNMIRKDKYKYNSGDYNGYIGGWRIPDTYYVGPYYSYCDGSGNGAGIFYSGIYKDYHYDYYDNILLEKVTTTQYFDNDSIMVGEVFIYNSDLQLLFKSIGSINDNISYAEDYTYPSSSIYPTLYNKHVIGLPITIKKTKIKTYVTTEGNFQHVYEEKNVYDKVKYDYDNYGNITKRYDYINDPASDYVSLQAEYSYISGTGKLQQVKERGDYYTTYLWAYNKAFPVAKIEGALLANVTATGISVSSLQSNTSNTSIKSVLDALRSNIGTSKLVTTYLYEPIHGVTEISDYNNFSRTFSYDQFGRLTQISNADGNMVEEYDYHYAGSTVFSSLSVSVSSLSYTSGLVSKSVSVSSNVSWAVTDNQSWITVSPASGTNNGSFTVTCAANSSTSMRSGTVTITGGGITKTISISQEGTVSGSTLSVDKTNLYFDRIPTEAQIVNVSSNTSWVASASDRWIALRFPSSGTGNGTISVKPFESHSGRKTGTITLTTTDGTQTVSISIVQFGLEPLE